MTEPWVSVDEVARHLGVRKDSVYRWIDGRGLPAQKIGKLWKLKLSEVDAWMRAGGRTRAPSGPLNAVQPAHEGLVLVVDDDKSLRDTVSEFLGDQGYGTLVAGDGAQALALLRAPHVPRPDLIVLDLVMPGMDGWQFLEEQRRDAQLGAIPVVLITAERRFHLVGSDVLWKPLDLALLLGAVRRRLEAT